MSSSILHRYRPAALLLWCAALLSACGGAGEMGSGGTGAAASAEGTVTGFGSIYVDGVRFDDTNAAVQVDSLTATPDVGETKLGQRVEVSYAVDSVAQSVTIEPEVVGVVTQVTATDFKVLGQAIVVNTDPAAGPVTQFEGYTGLGDVRTTDLVEVHGVARTASPGSVIQATRVEKLASLPYLRVAGTVAGLSAGPKFMLGALQIDATTAAVVPAGKALANRQSVVVLAATTALSAGGGTPTLTATRIRIRERANGAMPTYVGGVISNRGANTFNIGDVVVRTDPATNIDPPGVLADGQYVQVRGNFNATGELAATQIKVRSNVLDADLRGTVIGYVDATTPFTIRGVTVKLAQNVNVDCGALVDLSGQYVEVSGRLGLDGVVATSVKCKSEPSGAVIERRGTSSNVSTVDNTFRLTTNPGSVTVRWTPLTFFADNLRRTQASLDGKALRVEGVLTVNNVLVATKIRLDH